MKKQYSFFKNSKYALAGVKRAFKESAFRIEVFILIPLFIFAIFYPFSAVEKIFLLGSGLLVLMAECFNTAIECVVDLATLKYDELAKNAKDLASAGVFFSLIIAGLVWLVVLWENFL